MLAESSLVKKRLNWSLFVNLEYFRHKVRQFNAACRGEFSQQWTDLNLKQ